MMIELDGRVASKKNSKRIFVNSGHVVVKSSEAYENYETEALWQLKSCHERFTGEVRVAIRFEMVGQAKNDLDNMITSIFDILAKAEIIDNDRNVVEVTASRMMNCTAYKTFIVITAK